MDLLRYWLSQYVFQSVFHSLLIAVVVETLLRVWREERPMIRLRFLLLTIWIPVLSFPLFQLLHPDRGSYAFRRDVALFDLNAWLLLRLWGGMHLWQLFLLFLGVITLLFLFQDLIPMIAPYFHRGAASAPHVLGSNPRLDAALEALSQRDPEPLPGIFLVSDRGPILYSAGLRKGSIHMSDSLIETLDQEELEGVLAHEVAHIRRRDNVIGWVLLFFRILVFFNPVALIEFRRIIHEREKLCDDLALALTGKQLALASGLAKVFRMVEADLRSASRNTESRAVSTFHQLELHSQRVRIEDRVLRLTRPMRSYQSLLPHFRLWVTTVALLVLLFFVV